MVNSTCNVCKIRFNTTYEPLGSCVCNEIYHIKCFEKIKLCATCNNSEICDVNSCQKQQKINIESIQKTPYTPSLIDHMRGCFIRIPFLLLNFSIFYLSYMYCNIFKVEHKRQTLISFLDSVNYWLNIHVKINGLDKINTNVEKIYVGNHISYHEALIIPRFIRSCPIASLSAVDTFFGKMMAKYDDLLVVKRGESGNTVKAMNEILEGSKLRHKSIFIFPQGILGSYKTLTQFRTGGFATNYPVQPVIINYLQNVSSMSMKDIIFCDRIDAEIHILDIIEKDKDENISMYTEKVRSIMANHSGFALSDVTSHDAKD